MSQSRIRTSFNWLLASTALLSSAVGGSLFAAVGTGEIARATLLTTLPMPLGDCWLTASDPTHALLVRAASKHRGHSYEQSLALGDWWPSRD